MVSETNVKINETKKMCASECICSLQIAQNVHNSDGKNEFGGPSKV